MADDTTTRTKKPEDLKDEQLDTVAGGLNPQPLPPVSDPHERRQS